MSESLADLMHTWYVSQVGTEDSLIGLERQYFGASDTETWADAALRFYAGANGSSPVGSLNTEAFIYYSGISGLEPAEDFTLTDHMYWTFAARTA